MGHVPVTPRNRGSFDKFRRDTEATIERIGRQRIKPQPKLNLVKFEREEWYPPGTAYLDESQDL